MAGSFIFKMKQWRYEPETKTIRSVPENHWICTFDSWDGADKAQTLTDIAQIEAVYDNMNADRYYVFGNHDLEDC